MFKKFLLASAFLVGGTVASHAVVIFADNFDANTIGNNKTPAGWVLDYGNVDIIGAGSFNFYPGNGRYIDMNGSSRQSGGIHTLNTFNFLAGKTYTVSFDYGNNPKSANNGSTETLIASVLGFPGITINQVHNYVV
jgi:hypothetical protein